MLPPIAGRFVAGETAAEAIEHALGLNDQGLGAILNLLGEHYTDRTPVRDDTDAYLGLIDDIARADVDGCISVKPTQLGLDIGEDVFREHLGQIVEAAATADVFVWIDMEGSETTEATIDAFESMVDRAPWGVGLCLQSNLKRTAGDIERLAPLEGKIRLVKGAYRESPEVAYRNAARVDERYRADLESLFRSRNEGVAVATHDPAMISHAKDLHAIHGTGMEFQLLMGVRPEVQRELAAEYRTVQYVPYGSRWFSYFTRRVLERTENATFAARAILGR